MSSGSDFLGDRDFWVKPFGSWADYDDQGAVPGFESNAWGVALGGDTTLSDTTRVGLAFAYATTDVDSNSSVAPQSMDVDVYQLIAYGSHSLDSATEINFQVDGGINNNQGSRIIALNSSVASSDYDSHSFHAGAGLARTYAISPKTTVTPSIRADYTWIKEKSYVETGADVLNLSVDDRTTDELILGVDANMLYTFDDRTSLTARLGVGYDVINDEAIIVSAYAGAPGAAFATYGLDPEPWLGRAGLGLVHSLASGVEITARYDAEFRDDFTNQTASIKARWAF
jgi:outer membrane autotransporter protein